MSLTEAPRLGDGPREIEVCQDQDDGLEQVCSFQSTYTLALWFVLGQIVFEVIERIHFGGFPWIRLESVRFSSGRQSSNTDQGVRSDWRGKWVAAIWDGTESNAIQ